MDKLFNIGVSGNLSEQLKGKIILTNQMTLVLFFVGLLFSIVSFSFLPIAQIAVLGIILLILGVFVLNHLKYFTAARVLISLLPPVALSLIHACIVQPHQPLIPSFTAGYICIALIPFLIFDIREKMFLALILLVYWAIYLLQGNINQWVDIPMDSSIFYEPTMNFISTIFNIGLVSFDLILFQTKNFKSEQENKGLILKLQKKQIKLATQSDLIKKQNETIALANIKLEEKVKDRTKELNEKNELLHHYFDNLPGVVYHGKVDGTIQPSFISKGSIDVIGAVAEELVEKGIYHADIVDPEYLGKIAKVSQQAQQTKDFPSGYELTYPIKTQTGRKWVLDKGKFTKAENGDIFYNGIWLDITAKVEAEDTLRETKEQLQLLLESSEDMITLHDDHGNYLYYNGPKCYDIQSKDIVGKTAYDFFERESAEKITFHIKEVFQSGKSVSFESYLDWLGAKNWFSEYIYPVKDRAGNVKSVAKICRDIQKKKIAEQRLKEHEQLLSTIYNSTKDVTGLVKVHPDGSYTLDSVNQSFIKSIKRFGIKAAEIELKGLNLATFWKQYLKFPDKEIKSPLAVFDKVKTTKESITYQSTSYFVNMGEVIIESTLTPILDIQNNCEYILFVLRDNTEKILAQRALKASQEQLFLVYNNTQYYMGLIRYEGGNDFTVESLNDPMWDWLDQINAALKPKDILKKDLFNYYDKVYGLDEKAITERINLFKQVTQTKESLTFEGSPKVNPNSNIETYHESTLSPILDNDGNVSHVLAVIRNITERKRVENELLASEAHAKALFEYSPIIIWEEDFSEVKNYFDTLNEKEIKSLDTYFENNPQELERLSSMIRVKDVNQKSVEFYETGTKENHITDLPAYFIEESWKVLKAELIALANGATTFESEIPIKNQKGEIIHFILQLAIPPEYSETWESVIVSFIDITERKKAEQLLSQSKTEIQKQLRQNQLILNTMQDGYILADTNANIVDINPAYCKLMGYSRNELIGININKLEANYSKEQVDKRTQLMKKSGGARFEFNHVRKDGGIIYFDANLSYMQFEKTSLIAGFMRDITSEKKARAELDYRLRFESLLAKISNEFINLELNNIDKGIDNALKLICKFTGFDRSFIVLFDLEKNTSSTSYEWCEPGINSVKANFQNIPFNKYPWLINRLKNNEPVVLKNLNELAPSAKQLKKDLVHGSIASLIHVPILWQGKTFGFIGFDAVKNVNYFPKDLAILLRFAGEMIANILKRKEGEQALRASEHQLSMIYNNTTEFIGLLKVENKTDFYIQSFNKAVYDGVKQYLPDLDLNIFIGQKMTDFYKNVLNYSDELIHSRNEEWKGIAESKQTKVTRGELPIPFKGRPFFAFETNFIPIINQQGDCDYLLFVANDMTEKTIAEQAIKASEQRLSLIYNNNMDFIGLLSVGPDDTFKVESINHPAFAFLNKVKKIKSMEEVIGMEVGSIFGNYFNAAEAEVKERTTLLRDVARKRERILTQDTLVTDKGEVYKFESTLSPIMENGECVQILYVIKDITEKEKAKVALLQSEKRLSSVFNGTKDQMAIFSVESEERIILEQVNQTFKNAWEKAGIDLKIDSIYGKDINFYNRVVLRLSERKSKERQNLIKQIINDKKAVSYEDEYYALNEKNYYMEVTISPLINDFGNCTKILFVARDVTFKKKADERLISKILETEDRERKRISKELHDSLGQNLTTASLNLNYLKNAITQIDDTYKIKFKTGIKFLNNAIDESRNIAHNLMPQSIVDFGYAMTIESLFEDLNVTSDTQFVFYENLGGERLASYQELSLFRITQEAINNILKHAKASKVTLQLMKYPDMILLTIEDNGKGFEMDRKMNSNFGINSMSTRVKALSGTIHIDSSLGTGTSITIEIPL